MTMSKNKSLFRRQFLMTKKKISSLRNFNSLSISEHFIYTHPDLEVTYYTEPTKHFDVCLLGFITNPFKPEESNLDILKSIAACDKNPQSIGNHLGDYGGRFVIMIFLNLKFGFFMIRVV